jgi:hypothetical protein
LTWATVVGQPFILRYSLPNNRLPPVANQHRASRTRHIPKARQLRRSPLTRIDVTRGEYNRIIDVLNERNVILNSLRDAIRDLQQTSDIQFKRIAQLQAELDGIKRAWERLKTET